MEETKDLLQIKIDKARSQLSEDALASIDSVDWRAAILALRAKRGYTLDQLNDLEIETELVLCGLLSPTEYPKELEKRMNLSKTERNDLVKDMNDLVFSKIKEALIKRTEQRYAQENNQVHDNKILDNAGIKIVKEDFTPEEKAASVAPREEGQIMKSAGIEIVPEKTELNAPKKENQSILAQKLSGTSKNDVVKTEHTLENITKKPDSSASPVAPSPTPNTYPPNADPYRLPPE